MRNFYIFSLSVLMILVLSACGGGGSSEEVGEENPPTTTGINMLVNNSYIIEKGQTIIREEEGTIIELESDIDSGVTTAVLISGIARIDK